MSMQSSGAERRSKRMWLDESRRDIRRILHKLFFAVVVTVLTAVMSTKAAAQTCSTTSFPYTLTNGSTADASQVMADLTCAAIYGLANWGGNVGIGTTSPSVKLQVEGAMSMDGNVIYFRSGATDINDFVRWNSSFDGLDVAGWNGINLGYMNTGNYVPTLTVAAGNVGIGTTNPQTALQVFGAGTNPALQVLNSGAGAGNTAALQVSTGDNLSTQPWQMFARQNSLFFGQANVADYMVIENGGYVGIGTTSPWATLDVRPATNTNFLVFGDANLGSYTTELSSVNDINNTLEPMEFNGSKFMLNGGNVGINTPTPAANLDINGSTAVNSNKIYLANGGNITHWIEFNGANEIWNYWTHLDFQSYNSGSNTHTLWLGSTGNVGIGTMSPTYLLYVNGQAGGLTAWANASDIRLKKNIIEITGALQLVQKLRGVRFDWKSPKERTIGKTLRLPQGEHEMGLIAQEVEKVIPEAVAIPKTGKERLYGVKEADLVPLLIEAIKEQQHEIKDQQQEITKLQSAVAALQQTISKSSH